MNEEKESILFKKLDLAFVYVFIFAFGLLVVFIMTTYLNNKVEELTDPLAFTQNY